MATTEQIAMDYYNRGMQHLVTNHPEDGVANMEMAASIFEEIGDNVNYIKALRCYCVGLGMLGATQQMITSLLKGLSFCDEHHIRGAKHLFYTTICDRYMNLGDYDSAINYGLMAVQDIETYGDQFPNAAQPYVVAYLNLSYCYLRSCRYKESELYLIKTRTIAEKNDIHSHDFSLDVISASIHNAYGDAEYVYEHKKELMNFIKSINITVEDFVDDVAGLVDLFCRMGLYEDAILITKNLEFSSAATSSDNIKVATAKLYMKIYKQNGDMEKYRDACVAFAENQVALRKTELSKQLNDMDTHIALSIAMAPLDSF